MYNHEEVEIEVVHDLPQFHRTRKRIAFADEQGHVYEAFSHRRDRILKGVIRFEPATSSYALIDRRMRTFNLTHYLKVHEDVTLLIRVKGEERSKPASQYLRQVRP